MDFDLIGKNRTAITEKIKEAAGSALPIVLIVTVLCLCAVPMRTDLLLSFFIGTVMVIAGMGFFTLGADAAMTPIGNKIGTALTKTKNMPLILTVSFVLGFAVTVAEPDLQVLANTVPHINSVVLLLAVGSGVGLFLAVCMVRILYGIKLRWILFICYALIFVLSAFSEADFLSIAFDSGGVTTGPRTVPFILAFGVGVSHIRSDESAESDSFGLVALCSVGPILAVLILGFFYSGSGEISGIAANEFAATNEIGAAYLKALPAYMKEVAQSLLPIIVIFLLFQAFLLKLSKRKFLKILIGIMHTYIGLVLFLTGVNVGFSSLGTVLGSVLANGYKWFIIPLAAILGWFIISAEPAVAVLEKQIEEVSAGAIGGTPGSPTPPNGRSPSGLSRCTDTALGASGMRASSYWWKLSCWTLPSLKLISPSAARPRPITQAPSSCERMRSGLICGPQSAAMVALCTSSAPSSFTSTSITTAT